MISVAGSSFFYLLLAIIFSDYMGTVGAYSPAKVQKKRDMTKDVSKKSITFARQNIRRQ
jgi:hypothetical protein